MYVVDCYTGWHGRGGEITELCPLKKKKKTPPDFKSAHRVYKRIGGQGLVQTEPENASGKTATLEEIKKMPGFPFKV